VIVKVYSGGVMHRCVTTEEVSEEVPDVGDFLECGEIEAVLF
jgi:hypothetical protein